MSRVYFYHDAIGEEPAAPAAAADPIQLQPDGRVKGIDGMLNQVSSALVKQASKDENLQQNVGMAVGKGFAKEAAPWLALGAGALVLIAVVYASRSGAQARSSAKKR